MAPLKPDAIRYCHSDIRSVEIGSTKHTKFMVQAKASPSTKKTIKVEVDECHKFEEIHSSHYIRKFIYFFQATQFSKYTF